MGGFVPPIRRVETAAGKAYFRDGAGNRVPGVTTVMDGGLPKPALINWAAEATAEYAVDHWEELGVLGPAARLKKLKQARYDVKDTAGRRGTEVHRAAEKLLAGQQVQVPDDIAGHVEAYARFLEEFQVEPVLVEFGCVSYRWGYSGVADLFCKATLPDVGAASLLIDLKTNRSGVFAETGLQLAGYRFADVWLVDGAEVEPYPADFCAAVHVRADGYSLLPIEAGEREHKDFLYAQRISQFMARSRDLVGPAIIPPTTSTFRLIREQT